MIMQMREISLHKTVNPTGIPMILLIFAQGDGNADKARQEQEKHPDDVKYGTSIHG